MQDVISFGVLRKHTDTGALVWFPSGFTHNGEVGVVLTDSPPWRIGSTYTSWIGLEEVDSSVMRLTIVSGSPLTCKLVPHEDVMFSNYNFTDCCKQGPITKENYCPNCGAKIERE